MALVFEIRNPDGSMHLDLSKRVTRYIGTFTISASQPSGAITHPAFGVEGRPYFHPVSPWVGNFPGSMPWIIARSNSITWEYRAANNSPMSVTIAYGVF